MLEIEATLAAATLGVAVAWVQILNRGARMVAQLRPLLVATLSMPQQALSLSQLLGLHPLHPLHLPELMARVPIAFLSEIFLGTWMTMPYLASFATMVMSSKLGSCETERLGAHEDLDSLQCRLQRR